MSKIKQFMEDIIQKAFYYCALVYVNGNENLIDVWDDSRTAEQKSAEVSEMLNAMGYRLVKNYPLKENKNSTRHLKSTPNQFKYL